MNFCVIQQTWKHSFSLLLNLRSGWENFKKLLQTHFPLPRGVKGGQLGSGTRGERCLSHLGIETVEVQVLRMWHWAWPQ